MKQRNASPNISRASNSSRNLDRYVILLIVILGLLQGFLFISGFRLTADDISFHQDLMNGVQTAWISTKDAAISSGRIVHLIALPVSIVGAYFADNLYFRIFYTTLYFVNFALVGKYVSKLAGVRLGLLVTLILVTLHPLDYFHLAPNAYPFHVSLPIFLITISRIKLLQAREAVGLPSAKTELIWLILCFVGIMFNEYGFAFGMALIIIEFSKRVFTANSSGRSFGQSLLSTIRHRYSIIDLSLVSIFLSLYIGFRFAHPSTYAGNQMGGEVNYYLLLKTLFGHIYGGTPISSIIRHQEYLESSVKAIAELGYIKWTAILAVGCATTIASFLALGTSEQVKRREGRIYFTICLLALFFSTAVTIPVAITKKYQGWCNDINSCVYLDSRVSHFGVAIIVAAVMLAVVSRYKSYRSPKIIISLVLSLFLGSLASVNFLINLRVRSSMIEYVSGWKRATDLACLPEQLLKKIDWLIPKMVDPAARISFHPGFDVKNYWLSYIKSRRLRIDCDIGHNSTPDFFKAINFGQPMGTNNLGPAAIYLSTGWDLPDDWGTWSNASFAEIVLPLESRVQSVTIQARALVSPSHPKQTVRVRIADKLVAAQSFNDGVKNVMQIDVPLEIQERILERGLLVLNIELPDAISPRSLGINEDLRKLAIGLQTITIK